MNWFNPNDTTRPIFTVCAVALMVSDRHPLYEGAPPWQWGNESFAELQRRFITSCAAFALAK